MSERPEAETPAEFSDPNRVVGTPAEARRAPEGEGNRAPLAQETGGDEAQFSIFDGAGNEDVVVVTENAEGKPVAATGHSADEARKSVDKMDTMIGDGYSPEDV
ncbi:MAG TPA: hypothetical protein VHH09_04290 [Acidimicrobiales bacterium]|nr:hypothetical protein [Acidimicrobiales bacterium]